MEEHEMSGPHQDEIDPFTVFMFGTGRGQKKPIEEGSDPQSIKNPDYDRLMTSIDTFVDSVRNLKPLLQKLHPVFEQIRKKK